MSIGSPYPASSGWPSTTGASATAGMTDVGTTYIRRFSLLAVPFEPVTNLRSTVWPPRAAGSVWERVRWTVVADPAAKILKGSEAGSTTNGAGAVSVTSPSCGVVVRLVTTTGTVTDSPAPIRYSAFDRPPTLVNVSAQSSYSAKLPQRWKRPSMPGTRSTRMSLYAVTVPLSKLAEMR